MTFGINDFFNQGIIGKIFNFNPSSWASPEAWGALDSWALTWIIVSIVATVIAAYLLGSINFAIIICRNDKYDENLR